MKCPLCESKHKELVNYIDEKGNEYLLCGACAYYEQLVVSERLRKKVINLKKAVKLILKGE